jgi:alpha-glucosidase
MTAPMLKSLGLGGFPFAGADVGGFAGTATPELLTKWLEIAAFQPIDRDHTEKGTGDQEPWVGGIAQEKIRRGFIEDRYRLMPYLYTLAEESSRTGLPMMRPLFLDYPGATTDKHPIDIDAGVEGEFLLGHDLLIAPSPYPEAPDAYTVEFPSADWFDFWSGVRVERPAPPSDPDPNAPASATSLVPLYTNVQPELASLPVYVRAGAILPVAPLVQSTDETPQGPLTLRVYAGDDCRGSLYTDDGVSRAYLQGKFLRMNFTCKLDSDGMQLQISKHEGSFAPWWKEIRVEVYGWKPAQGTILEDGRATALIIAREQNYVGFTVQDSGNGVTLDLR